MNKLHDEQNRKILMYRQAVILEWYDLFWIEWSKFVTEYDGSKILPVERPKVKISENVEIFTFLYLGTIIIINK
jgi:hypothetical protein